MILLSEMKIRKFFLPNWSWARQPLSSARSTLLYPFQMLNAKQGSSNSHLLTSFGMTRPGIEPTTSRLWGGRSTDWANTIMTQYSRYGSAKGTTWAYWERIKSVWKRLWVPFTSHVTGIWDSRKLIVLSIRASILFIVPLSRFHYTLRGLICAHLTSTLRCHWDCGAHDYVQGVVPML